MAQQAVDGGKGGTMQLFGDRLARFRLIGLTSELEQFHCEAREIEGMFVIG